jgi:hypothetical protein
MLCVLLQAVLLSACAQQAGDNYRLVFKRQYLGDPINLAEAMGKSLILEEGGQQYRLRVQVDPTNYRTTLLRQPYAENGNSSTAEADTLFEGIVTRHRNLYYLQREYRGRRIPGTPLMQVRGLLAEGDTLYGPSKGFALADQLGQQAIVPEAAAQAQQRFEAGVAEVYPPSMGKKGLVIAEPKPAFWYPHFRAALRKLPLQRVTARLGQKPSAQATEQPSVQAEQPSAGGTPGNEDPSAAAADTSLAEGVQLSPRPVQDTLRLAVKGIGRYRIVVMNEQGRRVHKQEASQEELQLDLSQHPPGHYYLRFYAKDAPFAQTYRFKIKRE